MRVRITKEESMTNRALIAADKLQKLAARWLTYDENRLINKINSQTCINNDAVLLHILHTDYGLTSEQLNELIGKVQEKSLSYNNTQWTVSDVSEVQRLLDIGVNIKERYEGDMYE